MQFNKTNFALAAGFTAAIISLVSHLLMYMSGFGMMGFGMGMGMRMGMGMMMGSGIIVAPIMAFIAAAIAGWLFAYFFNMLEKK